MQPLRRIQSMVGHYSVNSMPVLIAFNISGIGGAMILLFAGLFRR